MGQYRNYLKELNEVDNYSLSWGDFLKTLPDNIQKKLKNIVLPEPKRFFGALRPNIKTAYGEAKTSLLNMKEISNVLGVNQTKDRLDVVFDKVENKDKIRFIQSGKSSTGKSVNAESWEKVIVVAHNMENNNLSLEDAIKKGDVGVFGADLKELVPVGIKIIQNAKLKGGIMKHYGANTGDLTKEWEQYFVAITGQKAKNTTKTPKTDMYLNKFNISLKKAGGSQLMSGGQSEALATLMFAYHTMPDKAKDNLFLKGFTLLTNDIIKNFNKFSNVSINDIKKQIKKGATGEMIDIVKTQIEKNTSMRKNIIELTKNADFKKSLVLESMTGRNKFKETLPKSSHLMVFDEAGNSSLKLIDDKLVKKIASKTYFDISFKSARNRSWVALKGIVKESTDNILHSTLLETIEEMPLNEGFLSSLTNFSSFIKKLVRKWVNKIFVYIKKSFATLINILGLDISFEQSGETIFTV